MLCYVILYYVIFYLLYIILYLIYIIYYIFYILYYILYILYIIYYIYIIYIIYYIYIIYIFREAESDICKWAMASIAILVKYCQITTVVNPAHFSKAPIFTGVIPANLGNSN